MTFTCIYSEHLDPMFICYDSVVYWLVNTSRLLWPVATTNAKTNPVTLNTSTLAQTNQLELGVSLQLIAKF